MKLLLQDLRPGRRVWLTRSGGPVRAIRAASAVRAVPLYFRMRNAPAAPAAAPSQVLLSAAQAEPAQDPEARRRVVVLFGGVGRMEPQYRALIESHGYELLYRERRILGGSPPTTLAGVLVVASMVSHPLREHAARLAESRRIPIVYLRVPSLEAVRRGLAEILRPLEKS